MMVLPFRISDTHYSIFVVLGPENLDRIQRYDPAEVTVNKLGNPFVSLKLKDVIISFATPEEEVKVMELCGSGSPREALQLLSRGFKYRPGQGDYDGPYLSMRTNKKEPRQ